MMTRTILRAAAWTALAAIIFVTVSPIGWRPHDVMPVNFDRALAFTIMSALFVAAYPRHSVVLGLALVACAGLIELLQFFSPTRHPQFIDAFVKATGAVVGVLIGSTYNMIERRGRTKSV